MSDTPETDAFFFRTDIEWDDEVDFARKLERERNAARDYVFRLRKQRAIARSFGEQMERERNRLKSEISNLKSP
jgi:hypothetical protein